MHPSLRFWDVARKAGVTALFVLSEAVTYGMLPSPWDKIGTAVLVVASYAGVYVTRNAPQTVASAPLAPVHDARTPEHAEALQEALKWPEDQPAKPRPLGPGMRGRQGGPGVPPN